jgi:hypothetical protein
MTLPSFEKNDNPLEVYINEHNLEKEKEEEEEDIRISCQGIH